MADKAQVLQQFFAKVESDEKILRGKFPQISGVLQVGTVPAAVLQNYMAAREDVQQRMVFTRDLMRQYADPKTGDTTPDPIPLPAFGLKTQGLNGYGFGAAASALAELPPTQQVSAKDIVVSAPPVEDKGLGIAPAIIIIAVIGTAIVVTSIVAKFIVDAATEKEVKLAEQAVELEKQKNFATVWDTAQKLLQQCVGSNPTPDAIAKCWDSVATRFPDIVRAIPDHKLSSGGGGFIKILGWTVAIAGVSAVGYWGYQKWRRRGGRALPQAQVADAEEGPAWMRGGPILPARAKPKKRRAAAGGRRPKLETV